jgi:hypothetical protein
MWRLGTTGFHHFRAGGDLVPRELLIPGRATLPLQPGGGQQVSLRRTSVTATGGR